MQRESCRLVTAPRGECEGTTPCSTTQPHPRCALYRPARATRVVAAGCRPTDSTELNLYSPHPNRSLARYNQFDSQAPHYPLAWYGNKISLQYIVCFSTIYPGSRLIIVCRYWYNMCIYLKLFKRQFIRFFGRSAYFLIRVSFPIKAHNYYLIISSHYCFLVWRQDADSYDDLARWNTNRVAYYLCESGCL